MEGALKKLIPQLQTEVYTLLRGEIPSDDREMNAYLMNSLAINIDDIQNLLNSRDANHRAKLRSLTTQKEVSARKMYVEGTRNQIRRASLMGSTNNKNVLRDKDENRYMVFSLKGKICFDTVNQENFTQQFWAQIREEAILQKRNCNFTTDVTDIIISRNKKYLYRTDLEEFISDNFEYDLNAKEFSIGELKQHLEKEHICPSFTDNTLRKAIEMIIPADGQYNNRDNKGRWLCIKKKGDSNDRFSGVGNPLPF
jgi:predicted P-loop ATPase